MSDEQLAPDDEFIDPAEEPRSILSTLWFRAVLTIATVGVVGAIAMPYVLQPTAPTSAARPPAAAPSVKPAVVTAPPIVPTPAAVPVPSAPAAPAEGVAANPAVPPAAPVTRTMEPSPPAVATPGAAAREANFTTIPPADISSAAPLRAPENPKATPRADAAAGTYWIQVGAYKDAEIAKSVASRLRGQGYHIDSGAPAAVEAPAAAPAATPATSAPVADKYEVVVAGVSATTLGERLTAKGLAAEATKSGVVVKPALPLADAITLSKDFAGEGLKVQVRRVATPAVAAPAPVAAATPVAAAPVLTVGADGLHRVRVGSFSDRDAAVAALRDLYEKGYPGFIARSTP